MSRARDIPVHDAVRVGDVHAHAGFDQHRAARPGCGVAGAAVPFSDRRTADDRRP